jgi:hypothetical protein|tara:strand:+ start:636 stop:884 length:249 start_codon:yes stop_codon:yes gene_type:complete
MDANKKDNNRVLTIGEWLVTKFLMLIPVVNIILLIIWSFNTSENVNKSNWAKATLIVYLVRLGFITIIALSFLSFFITFFNF